MRHFLAMARASNMELQTQLVIARELEYGKPEEIVLAESLSNEVARMLAAMLFRLAGTGASRRKH